MRDRMWSGRTRRPWGIAAVLLALFVFVGGALPALAAGAVQDDGNLFSAGARTNAENKIAQIQRDTGKTVAVKTVPNLGGKDISTAADQYASQQKLNGVLIYAARDEKKLQLKVGVDTRAAVTTAEEAAIRDQMTKSFAANDFDGGLLTAIDRFGTDLRAATPARNGSSQPAGVPATATTKSSSGFPVLLVVLLVIVIIAVVLMVVMRRNRTTSGPSGGANYGPQGGSLHRVAIPHKVAMAPAMGLAMGSRAAVAAILAGAFSAARRAASAARSSATRSTITSATTTRITATVQPPVITAPAPMTRNSATIRVVWTTRPPIAAVGILAVVAAIPARATGAVAIPAGAIREATSG